MDNENARLGSGSRSRASFESFTIHIRLHIDPFGGLNKLPPMTKMENSFVNNIFIGLLRVYLLYAAWHRGNGNHLDQSTQFNPFFSPLYFVLLFSFYFALPLKSLTYIRSHHSTISLKNCLLQPNDFRFGNSNNYYWNEHFPTHNFLDLFDYYCCIYLVFAAVIVLIASLFTNKGNMDFLTSFSSFLFLYCMFISFSIQVSFRFDYKCSSSLTIMSDIYFARISR